MVRDGLANVVDELQLHGFEPRRVGRDAWEARCPVHRGTEHALAITRNEHNHVILHCRGPQNCQYARIIAALGLTNDGVYKETYDFTIRRLSRIPIQPSTFNRSSATESSEVVSANTEAAQGPAEPVRAPAGDADANKIASTQTMESSLDSRLQAAGEPKNPPDGGTLTDNCCPEASISTKCEEPDPAQALIDLTSPSEASLLDGETSACEQAPGQPAERFAPAPSAIANTGGNAGGNAEPDSSLQVLMRLASLARVFRSAEGRLFAQVPVDSRYEIHGMKSKAFREWLVNSYVADRGKIPAPAVVRHVLSTLEAQTRFGGTTPSVFIRIGHDGFGSASPFFIDLGDSSGNAISIGPAGWAVAHYPEVHFRRPEGLLALPVPSRGGSIELLRPYVNLSDRDFRLLIAWMAAALQPVGPYPILALYGEQAAAKSTLAKLIRLLIDPQAAALLSIPRGTRDLMVTGHNGWLLAYDNISAISDVVSDALCMVSTGGAYAGRSLFSNDERRVIQVQRPVILSGIEEFIKRGDLSDRSVYLELPPIDPIKRRREDQFWPAFHRDQPKILGALLDAVVGGLQKRPSLSFSELPRMADFAALGEAVGQTLHWPAGTFLADYDHNRRSATMTQLEDSVVANALLRYFRTKLHWEGTAAELLFRLTEAMGKKRIASSQWPKTARIFSNELRRIAPQLRFHGLSATFKRNPEKRLITILRTDFPESQGSYVSPGSEHEWGTDPGPWQ
jgi:hypothetical protein